MLNKNRSFVIAETVIENGVSHKILPPLNGSNLFGFNLGQGIKENEQHQITINAGEGFSFDNDGKLIINSSHQNSSINSVNNLTNLQSFSDPINNSIVFVKDIRSLYLYDSTSENEYDNYNIVIPYSNIVEEETPSIIMPIYTTSGGNKITFIPTEYTSQTYTHEYIDSMVMATDKDWVVYEGTDSTGAKYILYVSDFQQKYSWRIVFDDDVGFAISSSEGVDTPSQVQAPYNTTWTTGTMTSIGADQGSTTTIKPGRWLKLQSRCWISEEFNPVKNTLFQFTHNLNLTEEQLKRTHGDVLFYWNRDTDSYGYTKGDMIYSPQMVLYLATDINVYEPFATCVGIKENTVLFPMHDHIVFARKDPPGRFISLDAEKTQAYLLAKIRIFY